MAAVVAQERNVAKLVQPVGIVDQQRLVACRTGPASMVGPGSQASLAELEKALERAPDPGAVDGQRRVVEELAALVLARRVADLGRAAADQRDRAVAGALHPAQHHDADEVADVQAVGGAVEADVGGQPLPRRERVDRVEIGRLVDEAALCQLADELRTVPGHRPACASAVSGSGRSIASR